MSLSFRNTASFGKRIEYYVVGLMLKEGLDVYMPLVDDDAIDAVVKKPDGSFVEVQIKARSKDVIFGDARLLHGAYGNYSTEERSLLTLWYHPNYFDLPASIRAAIWRLHNGIVEGVDTPINEGGISNWPEEDKLLLTTLIPRVEKDAPLKWNRIPNW